MACLYVHRQKELTGSDCGSQFKWLTVRSVNTHTLVPLFIYTTKNTALTSHWHRHFKHRFLVQSIPCKARLTLPVQQAHTLETGRSQSQIHTGRSGYATVLIGVGKHCRFLQSMCMIYGAYEQPKKCTAPLTLLFHDLQAVISPF